MDLIDFGLYTIYALLIGAVVISIVLPVVNLIKDPKALIRTGIVLVGFVVVFMIAYSVSSAELTPKFISMGVDEVGVKLIGAGLIVLYIFLFGSILAMIYSEITNFFK